MARNLYLAGAAALALVAASVQAEEHSVVVTGFSYFPAVVYAQPGDTIRFINESGDEQTVVGKDTGWTIGPLASMEEGTLTVNQETELAFYSAYAEFVDLNGDGINDADPTTDYGSYENAPIKAEITFLEPPLSEN